MNDGDAFHFQFSYISFISTLKARKPMKIITDLSKTLKAQPQYLPGLSSSPSTQQTTPLPQPQKKP